jgi:integrase
MPRKKKDAEDVDGGRVSNLRSSIFLSETDGKWHGYVTMGVKADGSPDRRHREAKTQTAVTEKVRKLEAQRDAGRPDKAGRPPTVEKWMAEYLGPICEILVKSKKMAPRTLDDYRSKSRNWIVPHLGKHRIDRLQPEHLEAAYTAMYDAGLSSSTVLKVHRILGRALTVAMRRDKVGRNVTKLIDAPEPSDFEIRPPSQEEARSLIKTAETRRNGCRWLHAFATADRQGECLGLRWQYIDLETGAVDSSWQIQRVPWRHGCDDPHHCGEQWHKQACKPSCSDHRHRPRCSSTCNVASHRCRTRGCVKGCTGHAHLCPKKVGGGWEFRKRKGRGKHLSYLPQELLPFLRAHRVQQDSERLEAGDDWVDMDLVYCGPKGLPIPRSHDWVDFKELCREAGVPEYRVHDARHAAATILVEMGVHIRTIQAVLGHARVTTTQIYTHVAEAVVKDAADQMGAALFR